MSNNFIDLSDVDFNINLDKPFKKPKDEDLQAFECKGIEFQKVDICGLVLKMKAKKRKNICFYEECQQLKQLIGESPTKEQEYRLLSVGGGFSSLSIIKFVAETEKIQTLYCSTFRIGKRHFEELENLYFQNKLVDCNFITSKTQKNTDKRWNYYEQIKESCKKYGWKLKVYDNHSKIILMKTEKGNYYVVETSSNLNENPKMEQFVWSNDKELFEWFEKLFKELMK